MAEATEPEETPESDVELFKTLGRSTLKELNRRLGGDEPGDIPGTGLINIANAYVKVIDKEADARKAESETRQKHLSVLEVVDGLPPEAAREILAEEKQKLELELALVTEYLQNLQGGE